MQGAMQGADSHFNSFLYLHKVNTLFWHNINKPEYWGFARKLGTLLLLGDDGG